GAKLRVVQIAVTILIGDRILDNQSYHRIDILAGGVSAMQIHVVVVLLNADRTASTTTTATGAIDGLGLDKRLVVTGVPARILVRVAAAVARGQVLRIPGGSDTTARVQVGGVIGEG